MLAGESGARVKVVAKLHCQACHIENRTHCLLCGYLLTLKVVAFNDSNVREDVGVPAVASAAVPSYISCLFIGPRRALLDAAFNVAVAMTCFMAYEPLFPTKACPPAQVAAKKNQ